MRYNLIALLLLIPLISFALSDREIGERIWKNECNGTREGLTTWNPGEEFPSMGIGHFIWYPQNTSGPFQETFPALISFIESCGRPIPSWMRSGCPWPNRDTFYKEFHSPKMQALRTLLSETVSLQTTFLIERLQKVVQTFSSHPKALEQFHRLSAHSQGKFALIDYLNFKGEGTSPKERYRGKGWGLLQVLETMQTNHKDPVHDFVVAAKTVLRQRVENAPSERNESRWLAGWENRLEGYL